MKKYLWEKGEISEEKNLHFVLTQFPPEAGNLSICFQFFTQLPFNALRSVSWMRCVQLVARRVCEITKMPITRLRFCRDMQCRTQKTFSFFYSIRFNFSSFIFLSLVYNSFISNLFTSPQLPQLVLTSCLYSSAFKTSLCFYVNILQFVCCCWFTRTYRCFSALSPFILCSSSTRERKWRKFIVLNHSGVL